jgi:hypothetical protein
MVQEDLSVTLCVEDQAHLFQSLVADGAYVVF